MKRRLYHAEDLGQFSQSSDVPTSERRFPVQDEAAANLVSSEAECNGVVDEFLYEDCDKPLHMPAIDIDFPVSVRESETPGHFHLFIDHPISWAAYVRVLVALGDAGLVEQGYVNASIERGATFVATRPWKGAVELIDEEPF